MIEFIFGNNRERSWNPRAKLVVPLMSNCTQVDNRNISRAILENLWKVNIMKATVRFLNSNEHGSIDLQQNTIVSAQDKYLERTIGIRIRIQTDAFLQRNCTGESFHNEKFERF
jgi:hypothetical protein